MRRKHLRFASKFRTGVALLIAVIFMGLRYCAAQGVVAGYNFDEGSGSITMDFSGNGNTGTISGATWVNHGVGKALRFNGATNNIVNCGNGASLNFTQAVTVAAWVFPEAIPSGEPAIAMKSDPNIYGLTYYTDGHTYFYISGGGNKCHAPLSTNAWHYVVGTYDGAMMRLYVDGVEVDSRALSVPIATGPGSLTIGKQTATGAVFTGSIDDVRIFNRALTAQEVSDIFTGLVAHYDFNAGSGTKLADVSGNGNTGIVYGAAQFVSNASGYALRFDGANDYVDCGSSKSISPTGAVSVVAWILCETVPSGEPSLVMKGNFNYGLTFYLDRYAYWYISGGGNHCGAPLSLNTWHQLAGTYNGAEMRLYMDGVLKSSNSLVSAITQSTSSLLLGKQGTSYFTGQMDEVRIYNRALSASEVQSLYNSDAPGMLVERPLITSGPFLQDTNFVVRVGGKGGLQVEIAGETYFCESRYSYPGAAIGRNHLSQATNLTSEALWIPTVQQLSPTTIVVQATGSLYRLTRQVELQNGRVRITDSITNTSPQDVGILVDMSLIASGGSTGFLLNGMTNNWPWLMPENPTVLLSKNASNVGLLPEDDIGRLHFDGSVSLNLASVFCNHFALRPNASYTFQWALYPMSSNVGYFAWINRIRQDWGANVPIQGSFMFWLLPSNPAVTDTNGVRAYLDRKKIGIAALSPWLDYDPGYYDHVLTRAEYQALMQPAIASLKAADPNLKVIGCIETDWVTLDPTIVPTNQLPQWPGTSGVVELTSNQTAIIDAANLPWDDSYKRTPAGNLILELYGRGGKPQTAISVYPEVGNYQYQFLMDQIDFLINQIGFDGFYIDEFSQSSWGANIRTTNPRFDGSTWDGTTVDISPSTGQITTRTVACGLVSKQARLDIVNYGLSRGKVVVANTQATTGPEQALAANRFSEGWAFDPTAWPEGSEPPADRNLFVGHLNTPIGLGVQSDPNKLDYGERLNKAVITYLRHGMVYYHYVLPDPPVSGSGSGEFGPVNNMFPITPTNMGKGFIQGPERIITCISSNFFWPQSAMPQVLLFDRIGRSKANAIVPTPVAGGWDVPITLSNWVEVAVVKPASSNNALVGKWTFNEGSGTTAYDSSGNGNNGTLSGGATYVASPGGYAVLLDGVNDVATFGPSLFNLSGPFTLEVWVQKTGSQSGEAVVFGKDYTSLAISWYSPLSAYYGYVGDNGTQNRGTGSIPTNQWDYLVLTYNGSDKLELFRNGVSQGSNAVISPVNVTANPLIVGGQSIFTSYFRGLVDQAAIYSTVLSNSEITAHFLAGPEMITTAEGSWSNHYGVALNTSDADGDGVNNLTEFQTGFNPTNSAAYAHIVSISNVAPDITITYLGANGDSTYAGGPESRTNVLEFATGGADGGYSNAFASTGLTNFLSGGIGLGTNIAVTDSGGATNRPARYYRIKVLVP